jgi:hypothetical protein
MPFVSVLITGNSCTGKTTLIDGLHKELVAIIPVRKNKFDLCNRGYMDRAIAMLNGQIPGTRQEANRALIDAHFVDSKNFSPNGEHCLLQDSYWERVAAYCMSADMTALANELLTRRSELYTFHINILLCAEHDIRESRARSRDLRLPVLDEKLFDRTITQIVDSLPNPKCIDTTHLGIEEVRSIALDHIRRYV